MATFSAKADGQTVFGSTRIKGAAEVASGGPEADTPARGGCAIAVNTGADSASALILVDSSGTEWCFWVHGSVLRFGTRADWLALTAGSAV